VEESQAQVPPDRTERNRQDRGHHDGDDGTPGDTDDPIAFERRLSQTDWIGLVIVILVVGATLRLQDLDRNPPEFFEDELSGAVSAWSIVTTGHDVERTTLPFLRTRLELKQPIYGFSTVPFWAVLGHTAFAARLPAVIFGLITIVLLMWVVRVLGRDPPEALLAGAIVAILPWAVHYSRAGWEPAALLPFSLAGIGLLWIGLRDGRRRFVVAAAAVLAVGAYTYHPALLMHVVLATLIVLAFLREIRRPDLINLGLGGALALVILVPYVLALRDPLFTGRTADISVFGNGLTIEALQHAWADYWIQWDPRYLVGGGAITQRINPGPVLFWWLIPVFIVGMDELLHRQRRPDVFLVAWLVLGPLPAALTADGTAPHFARGLLAMPPIVIISAIGTVRAIRLVAGWRVGFRLSRLPGSSPAVGLALVLAAVAVIQAQSFYDYYFNEYPTRSASSWGYGSGEALTLMAQRVPSGATVCIATNDISGFTFPQLIAYWVGTPPFKILETLHDGRCRQAGTYVLALKKRDLGVAVMPVATVPDANGAALFQLSIVSGPP
jgi:4-amino-4-deoxy-L-arabinose transferase-like glycosyltransferase